MTGKIILIAFCLSLLHREAFQNKCAKIVARKFRQAMTTNSKQAKGKSLLPPPPSPPISTTIVRHETGQKYCSGRGGSDNSHPLGSQRREVEWGGGQENGTVLR